MSKFWNYCMCGLIIFLVVIVLGLVGFIVKMAYDFIPYTNEMHQKYLTENACNRTGEFAGRYATAIYKCGNGISYTEEELRSAGIQSQKENK